MIDLWEKVMTESTHAYTNISFTLKKIYYEVQCLINNYLEAKN